MLNMSIPTILRPVAGITFAHFVHHISQFKHLS